MNLLIDTHVLLWAAFDSGRLSSKASARLDAPQNKLFFSAASLWEVSIKRALNRSDFQVDPSVLRAGLLSSGYEELGIDGRHCMMLTTLPPIHGDPFDRMLVAQAISEGLSLITADRKVATYPGPIEMI